MERAALATRRRGSAARCHEKRLGSGGVIAGSERNESVKNNSRKSADRGQARKLLQDGRGKRSARETG